MNDWFEVLANNSLDAIGIVTGNGQITFANDSFHQLMKQSGVHDELTTTELPVELMIQLQQARTTNDGKEAGKTFTCCLNDKKISYGYQSRIIPHPDSSKDSFLIEIRDNTKIHLLQSELVADKMSRQQEIMLKERRRKLFYGLLDGLPSFVYMQRKDYTVAFANKQVRMLYGDPKGKLCYEVFAGRSAPCLTCPTFEVFDTGQSVEWEFTDSNDRTFLIYDYPYEDEDGEELVLEMGVDITRLKTVEKELYKAQKLRAIGVLAGGIAHDLNNNLVPIIFNIEHVKGKVTEQNVLEPLEDALQAANQAAKLVTQVLEYSRQQDVSRSSFRIGPIIRECVKDVKKSLPPEISLQVAEEVATDYVHANATQIKQVVMNLIWNAQQSMPEGGDIFLVLSETTISESPKETGTNKLAPGRYLVLEVSDSGVGIRPENIELIFEPFFTNKKGKGGTGMGLAVVYSIVTGSGGDILVKSTPGIGSTFTVYLPEGTKTQETLYGEVCSINGDNVQILLVDDDPGPLKAMSRSLKAAGFQVDTAVSGKDGLEIFAKNPQKYSLILADQSMPDMTGLEMAEEMLAINDDTRILICTGHIDPVIEEQATRQGVAGFAHKPMSPKTLTETVKRHCRYR